MWKTLLRDGHADPAFAARGRRARSPRIHAATAGSAGDRARASPPTHIFHAIRLEPYLLATAAAHPRSRRRLRGAGRRHRRDQARAGARRRQPEEHPGRPGGPVLLDAECAWYGDPAFDLAFCLNHLLLKCLWTPAGARGLPRLLRRACATPISPASSWEPPPALEARAAALLPALLLARVDGKSPVEYLTDEARPRPRAALRARRCCVRRRVDRPRRRVARRAGAAAGTTRARVTSPRPSIRDRRVRPPRLGLARPADGRGRSALPSGARGRAIAPAGASTRQRRGGRPARRRRRVRRARRAPRGRRRRTARSRRRCAAATPPTRPRIDARADRARRHAEQGAPRRQRDRRGLDGGRCTPRPRRAGLPLWRHLAGDGARVRCRCPRSRSSAAARTPAGARHAGLHGHRRRRGELRRGAGLDRRGLPRRRRADGASAGRLQGVADEGGWWPAFDANEEALDMLVRAIERAGFTPGRGGRDLARHRRLASSAAAGATASALDGTRARHATAWPSCCCGWLRPLSRSSRSRTRSAEDDPEGLARLHRGASATACRSSATTSWSPTPRASGARAARGAVQRGADQAEPGGHADRDARRARRGARALGWGTIVSARSGETEDVTIVHLAVGWGAASSRSARSRAPSAWRSGTRGLRIEEALAGTVGKSVLPSK